MTPSFYDLKIKEWARQQYNDVGLSFIIQDIKKKKKDGTLFINPINNDNAWTEEEALEVMTHKMTCIYDWDLVCWYLAVKLGRTMNAVNIQKDHMFYNASRRNSNKITKAIHKEVLQNA